MSLDDKLAKAGVIGFLFVWVVGLILSLATMVGTVYVLYWAAMYLKAHS